MVISSSSIALFSEIKTFDWIQWILGFLIGVLGFLKIRARLGILNCLGLKAVFGILVCGV